MPARCTIVLHWPTNSAKNQAGQSLSRATNDAHGRVESQSPHEVAANKAIRTRNAYGEFIRTHAAGLFAQARMPTTSDLFSALDIVGGGHEDAVAGPRRISNASTAYKFSCRRLIPPQNMAVSSTLLNPPKVPGNIGQLESLKDVPMTCSKRCCTRGSIRILPRITSGNAPPTSSPRCQQATLQPIM